MYIIQGDNQKMTTYDGYNSNHKGKKSFKAVYRGQTIERVRAVSNHSATQKLEDKTGINKAFLEIKEVN